MLHLLSKPLQNSVIEIVKVFSFQTNDDVVALRELAASPTTRLQQNPMT